MSRIEVEKRRKGEFDILWDGDLEGLRAKLPPNIEPWVSTVHLPHTGELVVSSLDRYHFLFRTTVLSKGDSLMVRLYGDED